MRVAIRRRRPSALRRRAAPISSEYSRDPYLRLRLLSDRQQQQQQQQQQQRSVATCDRSTEYRCAHPEVHESCIFSRVENAAVFRDVTVKLYVWTAVLVSKVVSPSSRLASLRSWIRSTIDAHALSMMSPSFVLRSPRLSVYIPLYFSLTQDR
ncbi:uncharacterized protein LOC114254343 [Monomorium pharaonis]|uniref:uncharacterized protein LOC114254343 n=1 Tax=Monomorium pharaonis TaxID=307658 RepID=UPI001747CA37|nr:uncharacterized protein LOC114254343 [Monomorium pharaonis]